MKRRLSWMAWLSLVVVLVAASLPGCAAGDDKSEEVIRFADCAWDTQTFMVYVAEFIVANGYDYDTRVDPTTNVVGLKAIENGDIDVHMEVANIALQEPHDALIATGLGEDLGVCYSPMTQIWLVPTYMIEGDAARGIEPMMPDVKTVFDMAEQWELFQDPEMPEKGRFYGCIPGWQCEKTNKLKIEGYGLDQYYNVFTPGSDTALATSMITAYEKGEPWFGYYWQPTWVLGKVDMTPLEEPAWSEDLWNEESKYACGYPREDNYIVGATSLQERAPDVRQFLIDFNIPLDVINTMLVYLQDSGQLASDPEVTDWFLTRYEDVWTEWVPSDVADKVKAAL